MAVQNSTIDLEQSVESLARFPEENPNPVMRVSPDGALLYANSAAQLLVEYWKISVQEKLPAQLAAQIGGIFAGARPEIIEEKIGASIFALTFTPILAAGYLNVYGADITESRKMRDARDSAEKADRTKSEFLANMSHEIRTPMNGIMGMAELLSRTQLNSKQKMFADVISKSSSALLTIINDILDFSKIDAGKLVLSISPFSLVDAIEDVATLLSTNSAEKDVEIIVRIDPSLPNMFVGDIGRIRQIVTNIMGNAVKFTEEGHILVDVTGEAADSKRYRLQFRVTDTGIGIPEEQLGRIFEKFSQVDGSATRVYEGTGLGLAIATSLIELMSGKISVESKVGEGSTFTYDILLPVHIEEKAPNYIPIDVSGAHVLIVDDNDVNLAILKELMAAWQFHSTACSSGVEALAHLRSAAGQENEPDVVILDYQMPNMSGADVLRELRGDHAIAETPVVILSSVDTAEHEQELAHLCVQGHLTKPARTSLLLETMVGAIHASDHIVAEPPSQQKTTSETNKPINAKKPYLSAKRKASDIDDFDILIAEDNEVNQYVYEQTIGELDYTYKIADNGEDAIAFYQACRPRVILMDISMPVLNGFEATKKIRQLEAQEGIHTPIIAVTAHALAGDMEKCLEAGMDDYLAKPLSPGRLEEKIDEWIDKSENRKRA